MTRSICLSIAVTLVALFALSCGRGSAKPTTTTAVRPQVTTAADRILPLLPDGAQIIVEIDLARLRTNPVVGKLVAQLLDADSQIALPAGVPRSPLAKADTLVLASYGAGTSHAATVSVLATPETLSTGVRIGDGLYALGPAEWTAQLEARAAIAGVAGANAAPKIVAAAELLALRDRAMPPNAPGASLRITARLSFDARVQLARQTGLDAAPAQVSVWADVVDDLAIIIDADAADPGEKGAKAAIGRLENGMRGLIAAIADEPGVKLLGVTSSLANARLVARGTWLRTIVAVGPDRLQRVVERAAAYLAAPPPPEPAASGGSAAGAP